MKNTLFVEYAFKSLISGSLRRPRVGFCIRALYKNKVEIERIHIFAHQCSLQNQSTSLNFAEQKVSNMLDLTLNEENELKLQCKQALNTVNNQQIVDISLELFPMKTLSNPIDLLFKNLSSFYELKLEKKVDFEQITNQVLKRSKQKGKEIHEAFNSLFKTEFMQKFKKRIFKAKGLVRKGAVNGFINQPQNTDNTDRKVIAFGSNSEGIKPTKSQIQTEKNSIVINDSKSVSSMGSVNQTSTATLPLLKEIKRPPLTLAVNSSVTNNNVVTQSGPVTNLSDQDMCFCGKHVSLIEKSKQTFFQCYYCKKKYHNECMKRPVDSKLCTFCHLRRLIPNREVKKILFVGLLHKGRKRHQISLNVSEEDLSIQYKIQVRSFRIKEGCQNFILFPDSCNFAIKNLILKDFPPLHRQSSLKYRKDQPFYLSTGLHVKENKIVVTQKHPSKQHKDQRIVIDTHLIGIYLIQEKKVDWLVRQMKQNCFTSYAQSREILQSGFKNGNLGDQVTCEIIKIPLTCSLSTQKLKIPARGNFCSHFQCFDLKNFLQLIASSSNPRWLCPICKIPAFQFKIDIILHSILELQKEAEASELIFMRTGQFKVFTKDQKECVSTIKKIQELPIENKLKRFENSKIVEQDIQKKRIKTTTVKQ